jgi:phage-related protein
MAPRKPKPQANELFAIHVDGRIVDARVWKDFTDRYGGAQLFGWRPPKKVYLKVGHAKAALRQLPAEIRANATIVRYVPAQES